MTRHTTITATLGKPVLTARAGARAPIRHHGVIAIAVACALLGTHALSEEAGSSALPKTKPIAKPAPGASNSAEIKPEPAAKPGAVEAAVAPQDNDPAAVLAQGPASFDPSVSPQLSVVRSKTGQLLVHPTINGHSAGAFIFDSGAGICVVSTPHVAQFGLKPAGSVSAAGVGGTKQSPVFRADTLTLGPATFHDHPLMTTDLSFLKQYLGEEIVGIIGFGVLSQSIAEIDLQAPRIALRDPATYVLAAGGWSPLALDDRIPAVTARFEDHDGLFKLDLGANSPVTFYEAAVRKWSLLEGRETSKAQTGGVGGFVAAQSGVLAWLEFGGMRQREITATFITEAKGASAATHRDGYIGVPLLKPFVIVFDYGHERVAFIKRP